MFYVQLLPYENSVSGSHKLPLQTGMALFQYPVMWSDAASHVTFSAPIRLYPSLQRILHVDPNELSHFPLINPFRGGSRVLHFKTTLKKARAPQYSFHQGVKNEKQTSKNMDINSLVLPSTMTKKLQVL